jgi:hypothetical protein
VATGDLPDDLVERVRALCSGLPEVVEEEAWAGIRWTVRRRNFAHVVAIAEGWPPAYARAAGTDGPACVLTFRCPPDDVEAFRSAGPPFFVPVWFPNIVGLLLDHVTDWDEVAELVTESYRTLAPAVLAHQVDPPRDRR